MQCMGVHVRIGGEGVRSTRLPKSFENLLLPFRECFTRPGFPHFVGLVVGWVLCPGRHTISRVLQSAGRLLTRRHFSSVYRFLAHGRWTTDSLSEVLLRALLPLLPDEITVIVDDTLCHRTGPHLFGGGMFHDSAGSTYGRGTSRGRLAQFSFGHNWVVLAVWIPLPWKPGAGKAIPLAVRLYRSKTRCPESRYRKRTELALDLVQLVAGWLPSERTLLVLGDAEYGSRTVIRPLPDGADFVGPMPLNAALYATANRYRGRGRPRQRGRRLASPAQWARESRGWRTITVPLYGRSKVRVRVRTRVCLWYTVAGSRPIRMVITRDPRGRIQDRAYFCTDPDKDVTQILQLYARRWELEVTFREAKQSLGLEDPRNGWGRRRATRRRRPVRPGPQPKGNRGQTAVLHTAPLVLVTYALTIVWYVQHGQPNRDVAEVRKRAPWYRHKQHPSFDDMLSALQREIWSARLSKSPHGKGGRRKSLPILDLWAIAA